MSTEGTDDKIDPRETPAFRAVTKQVDELRKKNDELSAQLASLSSAQNAAKLEAEKKVLEEKGLYEQALNKTQAEWQQKLAERESELARLRSEYEIKNAEVHLSGVGVVGKARAYLARDYAALGEGRPEISEWVESIRENPEYSSFFSGAQQSATQQKVYRPGDGAGRAAGASRTQVDLESLKADLTSGDPRKANLAQKLMIEEIMKRSK